MTVQIETGLVKGRFPRRALRLVLEWLACTGAHSWRAGGGKHHRVKVDPVSLRRLIAWVDTMCPYRGDEEVRAIPDPVFQGVDWLAIRPKIRNAPRIVRPGPVD